MKWDSPRGPMMIDPETRDAVETIYIRRSKRSAASWSMSRSTRSPNVKDPVNEAMMKKK